MATQRNYKLHKNGLFPKSLEIVYALDKRWNLKFKRLLARNVQKRELEHTRLRENLPDRRAYKSETIVSDELSIYPRVKGKASNNIDTYMKNYKNRYMKKKGLSKLDCYYENKVFEKFCNICDIAEKMKYDKKRSKSFFLKKYGKALIILALIPAVGLIYPIIFGISEELPGIIGICPNGHFETSHPYHHKKNGASEIKDCVRRWMYENTVTIRDVSYVPKILSFIMIIIFILFIIYILIKVIKYEKIKAGKGKMSIKEYCQFCKEIF